jgi:hypothetical protein
MAALPRCFTALSHIAIFKLAWTTSSLREGARAFLLSRPMSYTVSDIAHAATKTRGQFFLNSTIYICY